MFKNEHLLNQKETILMGKKIDDKSLLTTLKIYS
jgi:hypothetical protein